MPRKGRSDTRERIFTYIKRFIRSRGYAPTVRDILRGCNLSSTAVVQHHLNVLESEGRIHRDPAVFRSIQLAEKESATTVAVPLLGTIAAGSPIPVPSSDTWTSEALETLEVPQEITKGRQVYALRVKGTSMVDALIDDGDVIIMEPASTARDGEMVAVWLKNEQEATLKRFYLEGKRVSLRPANPLMQPLYQPPENVDIQGRVVAVIRQL